MDHKKVSDIHPTEGENPAGGHIARQAANEVVPHHGDGGVAQRVEEAKGVLERAIANLVAIRRHDMGVDSSAHTLASTDAVTYQRSVLPVDRRLRQAERTIAASEHKLDLLDSIISTARQAVPTDEPLERGRSEAREAYKGVLKRALDAVALEVERGAELQKAKDQVDADRKALDEASGVTQRDLIEMRTEVKLSENIVGSEEQQLESAQRGRSTALSELSALRENLDPSAVLSIAEALKPEIEQQRGEAIDRKGRLERQREEITTLNERILRFRPQEEKAMEEVVRARSALANVRAELEALTPPAVASGGDGGDETVGGILGRWVGGVQEVLRHRQRG
ncbi:MAG: hypothetical protein J2P37_23375 [Ktedonobacteraceae bacterium]|nr:hypothetical protein [Ktedonobacteraceae bacterium]MBO0790779.1 hypothetical protein [Ktedonobacteraceae bacterium]